MIAYLPYLWLGMAVILGILSAIDHWLLFTVPGAVISAVLSFLGGGPVVQILVFVFVSVSLYVLLHIVLPRRKNKNASHKTIGLDDLIGLEGEVILQIDNVAGLGLVRVGEQEWAARALAFDGLIESGTKISVVAVEGVRLICRPL